MFENICIKCGKVEKTATEMPTTWVCDDCSEDYEEELSDL